ncbi:hypothetical protein L1987_18441 [Smallanthus sonchifolius]|uniref:Uncharacterized protein n=1 Tax=Smallanthus sonchifolius TaxID=185202 RepID=A0ACB9J2B9_9ASTR|nr:hypothetical protein L1987_18441 [Smallanthus sonchifolius]
MVCSMYCFPLCSLSRILYLHYVLSLHVISEEDSVLVEASPDWVGRSIQIRKVQNPKPTFGKELVQKQTGGRKELVQKREQNT